MSIQPLNIAAKTDSPDKIAATQNLPASQKVPAAELNAVFAKINEAVAAVNAALSKTGNTDYEKLGDTSDKYGFVFFSRLGAVKRLESVLWDEGLKKLSIPGSQALWEAHGDVTDGNMGIKALAGGLASFKLFDDFGDFLSTGTTGGKRVVRVNTALRMVNGTAFSESEFVAAECAASDTTILKSIEIPNGTVLTIDVYNIAAANTNAATLTGHAQFSFKKVAGVVTNISRDELRYNRQYSTMEAVAGYVTNATTRIDAAVNGTAINLNFINNIARIANVQCGIGFNTTVIPV